MELLTQRLVLREFRRADADTLFRYQSRAEYLEHYDRPAPTRDDVSAFVAMLCRWAEESPRSKYQLAITLADRVIGTCGVRKESPDATDAVSRQLRRVQATLRSWRGTRAKLRTTRRSSGTVAFLQPRASRSPSPCPRTRARFLLPESAAAIPSIRRSRYGTRCFD